MTKRYHKFAVHTSSQYHCQYDTAETAAIVHDIIGRLTFGDMVAKAPRSLNKVKDDESRWEKVDEKDDGVLIYRADDELLVIYKCKGRSRFKALKAAEDAVEHLAKDLAEEKARKKREFEERRKRVDIRDKFKVFLSDESWKDLRA